MTEDYIKPRRVRRRLKPKVKRVLMIIAAVIVIIIVLSTRPWRLFTTNDPLPPAVEVDTTQIPLNQLVQNSDSDIPEAVKFDKAVNSFMKQWHIEGASLAIMKDGNLIYSKGYGYANLKTQDTTEVKHIFRIASVSKLITAVGIMKLCEKRLLSLNSRVFGAKGILNQYTDYTDKKLERVTVENLLRHQGGFSIRAGDPMFNAAQLGLKMPVTPQAMVEYCVKKGLRYQPGGYTSYSNVGYMVLSQVIEKVMGMSYESYIKDSILAPIGCYDMHIGHPDPADRHSNEVSYYEVSDAELIPAADGSGRMVAKSEGGNNIELLQGAGGWVASPVELLKLVAAIDDSNPHKQILTKESIRQMTTLNKGRMPIGWSNVNDRGDWWRSGSMAGTSAMLRRQSNGYTWVFVTNTSSWKGSRFSKMINVMLQNAFNKVTEWPEKDLFKIDSLQG